MSCTAALAKRRLQAECPAVIISRYAHDVQNIYDILAVQSLTRAVQAIARWHLTRSRGSSSLPQTNPQHTAVMSAIRAVFPIRSAHVTGGGEEAGSRQAGGEGTGPVARSRHIQRARTSGEAFSRLRSLVIAFSRPRSPSGRAQASACPVMTVRCAKRQLLGAQQARSRRNRSSGSAPAAPQSRGRQSSQSAAHVGPA